MMKIAEAYPRGAVTALPDPAQPTDTPKRTRLDGINTFKFEHLEPGAYRVCAWLEEGTASRSSRVQIGRECLRPRHRPQRLAGHHRSDRPPSLFRRTSSVP